VSHFGSPCVASLAGDRPIDGEKDPREVELREAVRGRLHRAERSAAAERHGKEELVGEVLSDGNIRGEVMEDLPRQCFGDDFGTPRSPKPVKTSVTC